MKLIVRVWILFLSIFSVFAQAQIVPASALPEESFRNPLKPDSARACTAENIDDVRFDTSYAGDVYSPEDKIKICQGLDAFIRHSRRAESLADSALRERMRGVWSVFLNRQVRIIPLPKKLQNSMFIASAAYPRNVRAEVFQAAVYIPSERATSDLFFYAFWHELQHVRDLQSAWENYGRITNYELEFNGFYLASLLAEVYQPKEWATGQPAFWEEAWKNLSPSEQNLLRTQAIDKYIRSNPVLKDAGNKTRADYDFRRKKS